MSLLLSAQNISKYYAAEPVLDRISFDIRAGQHLALIGPNGAGKTTLLKILTGDLEPDRGEIRSANGLSIGILRQRPDFQPEETVWSVAESALQSIRDCLQQVDETARQIATTADPEQRAELERQFDALQEEITRHGGYQLESRIESVLTGLGFSSATYHQPVEHLSGGQVNRLMLAQLLLEQADLLLLDEPSNHLDIAATEWLEDFLDNSPQAFLLVSHDRYFLDRVVDQTWELLHGKIDTFPGNYSRYREQKAQRLEVQRRTYQKQAAEIARMEDFIRRNHYGLKHAQAEDRRKKLERIERVELPREITAPPMRFAEPTRTGDIVLQAKGLTKGFGERPLFENLNLQIERGQRWAVLGPNGCGKTTLLNCLLNQLPPDAGTVKIGAGVRIGFFDQQLKSVNADQPAYEAIRPQHKEMIDVERRDLLARFGLTGDLALQRVGDLSGGERNRVALAYLAAQDANVLILDEPTNHLDLWARHSLEQALKAFTGTLLMVSHDRYFINQVADHLIVWSDGQFQIFEGNYDTYRYLQQQRAKETRSTTPSSPNASSPASPDSKNNKPQRKKRKFKYRKVDEIETDIRQTEQAIERIHTELADPQVLRNGERVVALKGELESLSDALQALYEHWEEAIELN